MRFSPGGSGGILVDTTPDRIDEMQFSGESLARHVLRLGIAVAPGHGHGILDRIPIQQLLSRTPATLLLVVAIQIALLDFGAQRGAEQRTRRDFQLGLRLHRRSGSGIVDDGLQHGGHHSGWKISLALHDFVPLPIEDHGRRPAIIFITVGKIRTRVLVDLDQDVARVQQPHHSGIFVGGLVHHMAPMAPYRFEIEQDKTMLALSLGKYVI